MAIKLNSLAHSEKIEVCVYAPARLHSTVLNRSIFVLHDKSQDTEFTCNAY